jgi:hypothetical protein
MVSFQEVVLPSVVPEWAVEVVSPQGRTIRLHNTSAAPDRASSLACVAVLNVSGTTRELVATVPVDLRGSFNRLSTLVVEQLNDDPLSGRLMAC